MLIINIVILSVLLQLVAASQALRLIKITGKQVSWAFIAVAMVLMAMRRILTLIGLITGEVTASQVAISEWIGLVLSAFMTFGVFGISPFFIAKRRSITERDQAEEVLRESEEKYRLISENADDWVYWVSPERNLRYISPSCERLTGYSPAEFSSNPKLLTEITHPEDKKIVEIHYSNVREENGPDNLEFRIITKTGEICWISHSCSPMYTREGEYVGRRGTNRNITERIRAEDALRENERRLREVQEMAHLGFWSWNIKTGEVEWSDEVFKIFCLDPKGFTPQIDSILALSPWDEDNQRDKELINRAIETHSPGHYEQKFLRPDQSIGYYYSTFQGNYDENGNLITIIGTVLDITERKLAAEEIHKLNQELEVRVMQRTADLAESEERFRQLAEASYEAIIIHEEGVLIRANDQYYKLFGFEPEELLGRQVMSITTAPQSLEVLKKQIIESGFGPYEAMGLRKDGTTFPMEIRARNIEYKGRTVRVAAILDISSRKQAEESLHERTVSLEIANKELEAFSYSVSHDLRAPLRHINGYVDLLIERYHNALPEKGKHYLNAIADSAQQMGVLIDDLLQFSRTGRQGMFKADIDMNDLVKEVLETIKHDISGRTIKWVTAKLPHVYGDHAMLLLVWVNLLSNAVKFTRNKEKIRIEIGFEENNREYVFFVRDNGAGFDMQYAHKLFGVFQRLHSLAEFEGTGIGLANVHRIIIKHGGRVWAEAELNKGAVFYFALPKK
jgi:PAS domain S-box-containing protein